MSENEIKENPENKELEPSGENKVELPALPSVFGFKKGMSAIYNEEGVRIPVTVVECKPWTITQLKSQERDGYEAVQLGYGIKKHKNTKKPEEGHCKASGVGTAYRFLREVRTPVLDSFSVGSKVSSVGQLSVGCKAKVSSRSKGRGFSGAMKRHGFGGGPASHGSGFHRRPGSIGNCTFPGRVMPGRKMPGQYGNKTTTVKGIEVVGLLEEKNVLLLKGSIPGSVNSLVKITTEG